MFWKYRVSCPNCKQDTTIKELYFSAKGEVAFNLICVTCGKEINHVTSFEKVVISCYERDRNKKVIPVPSTDTIQ